MSAEHPEIKPQSHVKSCCRLCKRPARLSNSHIIPHFIFKRIFDTENGQTKNRYMILSSDPKEENKRGWKELVEKLLCAECEGRISRVERYASHLWFTKEGAGLEIQSDDQSGVLNMRGIKYKPFKLFLLSLLWRMGVSSDPFFDAVRLGARHEAKLGKMILSDDPGRPDDYGCFMTFVLHQPKRPLVDLLLKPDSFRLDGHVCYRLFAASCFMTFFVSSHAKPCFDRQFFCQENGTMKMPILLAHQVPLLRQMSSIFLETGKIPRPIEGG